MGFGGLLQGPSAGSLQGLLGSSGFQIPQRQGPLEIGPPRCGALERGPVQVSPLLGPEPGLRWISPGLAFHCCLGAQFPICKMGILILSFPPSLKKFFLLR